MAKLEMAKEYLFVNEIFSTVCYGTIAEILTVLFVGSEFRQLGFTQCFYIGTENSKTLSFRGSRER